MSCVLRVSAPGIERVLENVSIEPFRIEKGAAHFDVSSAGFDRLPDQIEDAIAFLRRNKADIETMMALPSSSGELDFGVANTYSPAQFRRFSPELVCLAGKAGLGLELSFYSLEESDGAEA
jgi:hypothetical protein